MALFGKKKSALPEDATLAPEYAALQGSDRGKQAKGADSRMRLLGVLIALMLAGIAFLVYLVIRQSTYDTAYVATAGELRMLSQRIAKRAGQAVQADFTAVTALEQDQKRFSSLLKDLTVGFDNNGVEVPPPEGSDELDNLKQIWQKTDKEISDLTGGDRPQQLKAMSERVATLLNGNADLLALTEKVDGARVGGSQDQVKMLSRMLMMTQRIAKNARLMTGVSKIDPAATYQLANDAGVFADSLDKLKTSYAGDKEALAQLDALFDEQYKILSDILPHLNALNKSKEAGINIIQGSDNLLTAVDSLASLYQRESASGKLIMAVAGLGFCVVLLLLRMLGIYRADVRRRAQEAESQRQATEQLNQQNQSAILRLMNELGDLADGDLTTTATVSEDITGAIADSINYTIEELRGLVGRINDAATQVTQMTEVARQTSSDLLAAAKQQSEQINAAGGSAVRMAHSMSSVSDQASQSAEVARASLQAAQNGTVAVEDSIRSMNEIRSQIQETAKRIKRLGESSQEIGEIVELISDITEQTNVLALNAAIQAASAGEAGRGFTVVAEEVQRLAERSAEATKQISALVRTIQTDTQEAVSAMEQSTQGVVEGAKRSDAAGQALSEIGRVSHDLAGLIEHISDATQEQSKAASQVAELMQEILSITEQTSTGTSRTGEAVEKLASLAAELKGSVAGFRVS